MENQELLRVNHLKKYFQTPSGTLSAVDDVTFGINRMETLGVVGESGCGSQRWGGAFSGSTSRPQAKLFLKIRTSSNAARRK